ncbi:MAG: hypothetical protein HRT90_11295 [Candidatus Margulisbacteria bacterium]|nr:hypothetical protein [Candidatus Margulisiibacteriota bacterium]
MTLSDLGHFHFGQLGHYHFGATEITVLGGAVKACFQAGIMFHIRLVPCYTVCILNRRQERGFGMEVKIGVEIEDESNVSDVAVSEVRFLPSDLVTFWKRCGLTADFMAEYQSFNFEDAEKATNILSSVVNELLENAVKFSTDKNEPLCLSMSYSGEHLDIIVKNIADSESAEIFKKYVQNIMTKDVERLFFDQLENISDKGPEESRLGLLTIVKDFGGQLGLNISPHNQNGMHKITLKVVLNKKEVEML